MKNFDLTRIMLLIRRYIRMHLQPILIGAGAVTGFVLVILLLTSIDGRIDNETFFGISLPFMLIGGYVFSSLAYPELNHRTTGIFYLTLPATSTERLASGWLLTGPVFVIVASIVVLLLSLLTNLFGNLVMGYDYNWYDIFTVLYAKIMGIYLVTQTIFLAGAAYFRRLNFFKVILTLVVLGFVLSAFSAILSFIIFGGNYNGSFPGDLEPMKTLFNEVVPIIADILFWGIMGPFFLLVTYFSIKEREV